MPRTQARLCTLNKTDADWTALTVDEQWLYTVLLRQHRLTLIGVLDVVPQRWCSATDMTPARAMAALAGLDRAGFVVVDTATAEVLVRTFVRHDIDTSRLSGSTRAGLWNAWQAIASATLRAFAVTEIPDQVWTKLEKEAPPEAAEIRRSTPLEREPAYPQEREQPYPHERPSSLLPPPTGVPTYILSPTGGAGGDEPGAAPRSGAEDSSPEHSEASPTGNAGETETTVDAQPALTGDALEQAVRRTAVLIGRRQTMEATGVDDADAYAAKCTRELLDQAKPEAREAITAALQDGETPEDITAGWGKGTDVFGFPTGDQPKAADPAAVQEAADRAKRREQETLDRIEAIGSIEPAPMPEHLRRKNRHQVEPEAAT